jgi:hypothetical protein
MLPSLNLGSPPEHFDLLSKIISENLSKIRQFGYATVIKTVRYDFSLEDEDFRNLAFYLREIKSEYKLWVYKGLVRYTLFYNIIIIDNNRPSVEVKVRDLGELVKVC